MQFLNKTLESRHVLFRLISLQTRLSGFKKRMFLQNSEQTTNLDTKRTFLELFLSLFNKCSFRFWTIGICVLYDQVS